MELRAIGMEMSTPRRKDEDRTGAHVPVLSEEVVSELARVLPRHSRGWLVDGTVGGGGHADLILKHFEHLCVLGLDQDDQAVAQARKRLQIFGNRARVERGRLSELGELLQSLAIGRPRAVLFDLGEPAAGHGRGRVTSVTWSPTLGKSIALGLYGSEGDTDGREVVAVHPIRNESVRAHIVAPVFLDPEGKRLRG